MSKIASPPHNTASLIKELQKLPSTTPIYKLEIKGDTVTLKPRARASFRDQYLSASNSSITPVGTGHLVDNFFSGAEMTNQKFVKQTGNLLGKQFSQAQLDALSQPHATVGGLLHAISNASGSTQRFSE